MAGRAILFGPEAGDDRQEFAAGPPIECARDGRAFLIAEGVAELFLRTPARQSFLGIVEAGDPVFPAAPEDAVFLLVARGALTVAPLDTGKENRLFARWREIIGTVPGESATPQAFNAALYSALDAQAAERDAAALARLRTVDAESRTDEPPPPSLADILRDCARALKVPVPDTRPGDKAFGFADTPRLAHRYGLSVRKLTLTGKWQLHDQGPLVLREGEGGALVSAIWKSGGYRLASGAPLDPGATRFDRTGYAISAPLPDGITGFWSLARHVLARNGDELKTIGIAATLMAILGAIVPLATGWLLNDIAPSGDAGLLVAVGLALLFAGLITYLLSTLRGMATSRIQGKTSARLSTGIFDRVLRLPASFFREYSAGDLNQRIAGIDGIRALILSIALSAGLSAILSIFYFGVLAYYGIGLALISLALVSVYIGIVAVTRLLQMPLIREAFAIDGRLAEQGYEMIGAVAKLRSAAAERRALSRWAASYGEERVLEYRAGVITGYSSAISDSWQVLTQVALFAGVATFAQGEMAPGSFIAFLVAFGSFQGAFVSLSAQLIELYAAQPQIDRALPILTAEPEIARSRKDPGDLSGAIEVRDISFGYDESLPPILSGVSLDIPAGAHFAVVGASGSGKSTLLRLLLGFETPRQGSIYYDGKELADLDLSLLRAQAGVVLQSSSLFAGSIIDNIRGSHDAGLEQCLAAAAQAGLARDLESFPMGIHTPITEGAAVLSGGQRQRILIARSLVARPKILFFDEATSALDNQSQALVAETLDNMDATRITIAHRLSTIVNADRICVLEKGKIAEQGSYEDLMAADGAFAALARRQLMEE
ncbi:ATP-binding cassette domain-containing protein [Parasphingopyxis marina]|uniref:ATP-binding cassette domain-containing protein n=1 Tax=Parasphingopyxis marina TaxID=2761622 RepID=A0A842HVR8_9SPHN|nr:ATP-binding cassette domain-containing protein [Parasphingopyxis marina]MBC2777062.1 ATP-binding cassette domain-containing protein [Parasphingopyxis marina]